MKGFSYFVTAVLAISLMAGISASVVNKENKQVYVTSAYSKYCYPLGQENPNMKKLLPFDSLTECGKALPDKLKSK